MTDRYTWDDEILHSVQDDKTGMAVLSRDTLRRMDPITLGVLLATVALAIGVVVWANRKQQASGQAVHRDLAERLERITADTDRRFQTLQQSVSQHLQSSQSLLGERTAAFEKATRELAGHFGRLQEAQSQLARTSGEILDFQKMLRAPSVRGGFGEVLLEALLADVLPADRYALQYTLSSGERADAVLKLADGHIVAVDAKFPLAAYEPLVRAQSEEERLAAERAFASDVKARAREIGDKYVSEADRTLPFALMYVPSEGVFYEIVRRPDLWEAITKRRVFPVSPSVFLPYVYTILVGLKGMKVQEEAQHILKTLGAMQKDFARVAEEFGKVGGHLQQAANRHGDAQKVFDRLRGRVEALGTGERAELPVSAEATRPS